MPVHYWSLLANGTCSSSKISLIFFCVILLIYFAIPAFPLVVVSPIAAIRRAIADAKIDTNAAPYKQTKIEHNLLLSDAVPLSPDAISVNTQEQSYIRYNTLTVMDMEIMVL